MQEWLRTGRLARLGSATAWRPQTRTAALLIGGFFAYFVVVGLRNVPSLVTEAAGNCAGPAGFSGYACEVPAWARSLAAVNLAVTAAELAVVAGAGLRLAGRGAGRQLMAGALLAIAVAEVVGLVTVGSAGSDVSSAATWQPAVSAIGAMLLCGLVATLRD